MMTGTSIRTIDDIAQIAQVSKSTVSRALNDSLLVKEETKEKILAIGSTISALTLRPAGLVSSKAARWLSSRTPITRTFP
jgi:LacI family transcriptional regulator